MKRLLSLVALLAAAPLPAQQSLVSRTLDSATVVRLHLVRGSVFQGVLLAPLTPDAQRVVFAPPAHRDCGVPRVLCRLEVPATDVRAVEVRRGSRAGRGALLGGAVGTLIGVALGSQITVTQPPCQPPRTNAPEVGECGGGSASSGAVTAVTALLGGTLGTSIGALFGLGSPTWERAP